MQHQRVVELRNDVALGNILDFSEVDHQTLLWVSRLVVDFPGYRNVQTIGMTMNVFAWAIVAVEGVGHVEGEDFGYSDGHGIVEG